MPLKSNVFEFEVTLSFISPSIFATRYPIEGTSESLPPSGTSPSANPS